MVLSEASSTLILEHKALECVTTLLSKQGIIGRAPTVWTQALLVMAEAIGLRISDILVKYPAARRVLKCLDMPKVWLFFGLAHHQNIQLGAGFVL